MAWTPGRFQIVDGAPVAASPSAPYSLPTADPTAGGRVDLASGSAPPFGVYAGAGQPAYLDTGGAFSAGDPIATDGQGRAVLATSGDVQVAEAIEGSSGSGDTAWVVFVTQREL